MSFRYLPLLFSLSAATNLYATHYSGTVYSLSLTDGGELSIASSLKTCGDLPSWLTLDAKSRTLYCSDETGDATTPGSLTSLSVAEDGTLTEIASTTAPGSGVNSVIYEGDNGDQYLAIAHYGGSAVSNFRLPIQSGDEALQVFQFELSQPGAVPDRQEAPHPHQVFLDPTGAFVLSPDLGADLVRVYAIDKASGQLDACPPLNVTAGEGPRHGLFWGQPTEASSHTTQRSARFARQQTDSTTLYVVTELGGNLDTYSVTYPPSGCLAFRQTGKMVPYAGGALPEGASPSEILKAGESLYISIRSDKGFDPNDSVATVDRAANGTLTFRDITSAYGTVPRTMVINKAGDLVAIGNQLSSNVAIVKRDPETGELGEEVANLQVGEPGELGTSTGLSSIIWGE
ncbi:hypothetical protein FE257_000583 [Aspergillus nanangensis]|uniref:6-phosphogluconolactonase n=1 Tax=Aspergillus nanangensis TaxID=2582783 RepID=A0AAD4GRA5_ASPNN|nr:hypothetical protein FE257_000583 [Aspergillus nanangensis]